jgi:hypothetical protein
MDAGRDDPRLRAAPFFLAIDLGRMVSPMP